MLNIIFPEIATTVWNLSLKLSLLCLFQMHATCLKIAENVRIMIWSGTTTKSRKCVLGSGMGAVEATETDLKLKRNVNYCVWSLFSAEKLKFLCIFGYTIKMMSKREKREKLKGKVYTAFQPPDFSWKKYLLEKFLSSNLIVKRKLKLLLCWSEMLRTEKLLLANTLLFKVL